MHALQRDVQAKAREIKALQDRMLLPSLAFLKKGWDEINRNNPENASLWFGQKVGRQ